MSFGSGRVRSGRPRAPPFLVGTSRQASSATKDRARCRRGLLFFHVRHSGAISFRRRGSALIGRSSAARVSRRVGSRRLSGWFVACDGLPGATPIPTPTLATMMTTMIKRMIHCRACDLVAIQRREVPGGSAGLDAAPCGTHFLLAAAEQCRSSRAAQR
jgi:hypothetical protein